MALTSLIIKLCVEAFNNRSSVMNVKSRTFLKGTKNQQELVGAGKMIWCKINSWVKWEAEI